MPLPHHTTSMKDLFCTLLTPATLIVMCSCSGHESTEQTTSYKQMQTVPATVVTTVPARVRPFEYLISASGKIASASEVNMQFKRKGIVENILVTNGQYVSKGQLLAVLMNETQEFSLSKADLALREKRLAFTDQMLLFNVRQDCLKYEKISANIKISSGLAAAEIAYEEAKFEFNNSFLRAQISGVVSEIGRHSGNPVSLNDPLCFIHDPENLLVESEVLETDALLLVKGVVAEVRPISKVSDVYPAVVQSINPRVNAGSGFVKVTLKLLAKSIAFPEMHVQVTFRLPYDRNLIIPKEAVVIRSGKHVVFTVSGNKAKWNNVTVGRENGIEIEILNGLKVNDEVITSNNLQLSHDADISRMN